MWKRLDWRLLGNGIADVSPGTWGGIAAGATAALIAAIAAVAGLLGLTSRDGAVNWLLWTLAAIATFSLVIGLFASGAWLWAGPVFAPLRAKREQDRKAAAWEATRADNRRRFQEAFGGWPEFHQFTSVIFDFLNWERERLTGYTGSGGPTWEEFVAATASAKEAAGLIHSDRRQTALAVLERLVALRPPLDLKTVQSVYAPLYSFVTGRDRALMTLAGEGGIEPHDFARLLQDPPASKQPAPPSPAPP